MEYDFGHNGSDALTFGVLSCDSLKLLQSMRSLSPGGHAARHGAVAAAQ